MRGWGVSGRFWFFFFRESIFFLVYFVVDLDVLGLRSVRISYCFSGL